VKSVCLAILNYNGRNHLEQLLPTAMTAAQKYPGHCCVLVLDNRSTDPDADWVRREFPGVEVVEAPENDFLFSYNWLAGRRSEDLIVFLNNDLKLDRDFVLPLARHLESADVFAAGASSYDWEGKERTCGPTQIKLRNGFYHWPYETSRQETCHTLFTSGGFMAVDRLKFLDLGGFNRLFHPAYHEDVELCFRAWRRGWRCVYEPSSLVWHREKASWNKNPFDRTELLRSRNELLFQWSSLPMNRQIWRRRWSVVKLVLGDFSHLNTNWLSHYLRTGLHWRRFKRQSAGLKVSEHELAVIVKRIENKITTSS